nr:NAD(P)-dependent oxidoreductase [Fodinicola feengrottensis]
MRTTVLGTGIMGAAMARNLAKAGLDLTVWNRSRDKAEPLAAVGATVADSPVAAVNGADVVITMLFDGDTVDAVMDNALPAMAEDALWLQMTTVGVDGIGRLASKAASRGVGFVDAPVMGTRQPAESGQLTVLAAGADDLVTRAQPVFDAVASKVVRLGDEPGAASRFKLVMNAWVLSLTTAAGQSIALAQALGIDPRRFLDAIKGGPLDSGYAQLKGAMMIAGDFPASFALDGGAKDAGLVAAALEGAGRSPAFAQAIKDLMDRAGDPSDDMAAVVRGF